MALGQTALMLNKYAKLGRTLTLHGVWRNSTLKLPPNYPAWANLSYIKAKFVSFGDPPPHLLSQTREADSDTEIDPPDDENPAPNAADPFEGVDTDPPD